MTKLWKPSRESDEYHFRCPQCGGWLRIRYEEDFQNDDIPEEEFLEDYARKMWRWDLVCTSCSWRVGWWLGDFLRPPYTRLIGRPARIDEPPPDLELECGDEDEEDGEEKDDESVQSI